MPPLLRTILQSLLSPPGRPLLAAPGWPSPLATLCPRSRRRHATARCLALILRDTGAGEVERGQGAGGGRFQFPMTGSLRQHRQQWQRLSDQSPVWPKNPRAPLGKELSSRELYGVIAGTPALARLAVDGQCSEGRTGLRLRSWGRILRRRRRPGPPDPVNGPGLLEIAPACWVQGFP
jgi:hypothetical protein